MTKTVSGLSCFVDPSLSFFQISNVLRFCWWCYFSIVVSGLNHKGRGGLVMFFADKSSVGSDVVRTVWFEIFDSGVTENPLNSFFGLFNQCRYYFFDVSICEVACLAVPSKRDKCIVIGVKIFIFYDKDKVVPELQQAVGRIIFTDIRAVINRATPSGSPTGAFRVFLVSTRHRDLTSDFLCGDSCSCWFLRSLKINVRCTFFCGRSMVDGKSFF